MTAEVYDTYSLIYDEIGMDQISVRRARDILDELDYLQITEKRIKGVGRGKGKKGFHRLLDDPEIATEVINEDSRFQELFENMENEAVIDILS